jgi:hypothetical protein
MLIGFEFNPQCGLSETEVLLYETVS